MKQFRSAIGLLLLLLSSLAAIAQPANDQFANAIVLTGPIVTATGSNVGATKQFGQEPFLVGGDFGGASVWWSWTAAASGPTTMDTEGSSFDTQIGVFTGAAQNQLALVAENGNYNGNTWSRVEFNAVAGTTYKIYVDGLRVGGGPGGRASQGSIVLHVKGVGGITFLTPTNGTVFTVGDPIPVGVTIDGDFPNPPATRVDFYVGANLFASKSAAPFSAVATNIPAGSNTVYVIAYDSAGAPVQSSVQNIFVQSIGVTLLTPFDDTVYINTNPIRVTAWSYLPGGMGAITNVEFFVDGVKFGETSEVPLTAVWSNVIPGSHRFTAVGRSDTGASYNSQPVNVGVASVLMPNGSVWKYLDDGSDQGTAWYASDFNDNSWASGPAPLGYSDSNGRLPATTNSFGPSEANKFTTTYFRQAFAVSNAASFARISLNIERDDGAVVYLNGVELSRFNMPTGTVTSATFAASNAGDDGGTIFSINVAPSLLLDGINVFAVEIHQDSGNSSDIWFQMNLQGIPVIIHNLSPEVVLTTPANNSFLLAPASVPLEATASDADGSVTKVEFFDGTVKIGEDTEAPYIAAWLNPAVGPHEITAVATDDLGAAQKSPVANVMIFDATGTPFARITAPPDGHIAEGPTNMLVTAFASATDGVTNVEFFANGLSIGSDATAPYSVIWNAPFGVNALTAVASGTDGRTGTSVASGVTITIPPTNVIAPTIALQTPLPGATLTNLTNIVITFSERVQNVDAADLLINGVPASSVRGNGSLSNFTFTFPQPFYGPVAVTWAAGHGITDYGYPTVLPFDETASGATWSYTLIDRTPPTIIAKIPAAGSTVTNLSEISVTFSEPVFGVDADDFLINGAVARGVTGADANYIFSVAQPAAGAVNITWSTTNNIFDLSDGTNAFNRTGAGATWSFTLDTRVTLVQSNSTWNFVKGFAEASDPISAWRQPDFDDSGWSNAPAPFYFGDPYTNASIRGTLLSDMNSNYTTIFLRREFEVTSRGTITNLLLNHQSDDGFIAWLNGVEVLRYNVPSGANGDLPYNTNASAAANEPSQTGAAYIVATLTNAAVSRLVNGRNILAIQAFNQSLTNSSDFGFNAQLYYFPIDATVVPPRVISSDPLAGDIFYLTNVTINFSEGVSGVDAADLLVNGIPASGVHTTTNATYTFDFPQPAYGPVLITWATNQGIADFDLPPKAFDGNAASARINYVLLNPSSPRIATQSPAASTTLTGLTSVIVTFTEPVAGVEASDLLVSGVPASSVSSADNTTFNFAFIQPPFGTVTIRWATNHGITDIELPPAPFDPTRFGGQWNYTLINPVPSAIVTAPTNNTFLLPPATVLVRATASDNDGTIARVELFQGDAKLTEATNSPVSITVSNLPLGTYVFSARATDNQGLIGTSAPVVINVVTSLPITLVRGPYLQSGTPSSGIVRWRTDAISDGLVYYGTDLNNLTNTAVQTSVTNEHIVKITGLEPDTQYYYSIGSAGFRLVGGETDGTNYWFRTSPVPGTSDKPVRLWVLGDAGTAGNGSPDRQASVRDAFYNFAATNNKPADLVMMLGDNAYNSGTDSEHQAAVFDMYPTALRNKFLWPTLGNHETGQSTTSTDFPYLHIFSLPQNGEAGGLASGTEKYYSFDYGNIHFVCLDSMTSGQTDDTPMANWLRNDLEATAQHWIIVFFHHPPYTKGSHDSDAEQDLVRIRQNINPILEAGGVDLVLNGHSHCLERSFLLDGHYGLSSTITDSMKLDAGDGREDGTGAYRKNEEGRGVVYNLAGSSGQATGGPLNHPAYFVSLNELGSLVLDVSSNRLDAQFITSTGEIHDHYTLIKQDLATAPVNLIARALDANNVALTWIDGATNELGYIIERSTDGLNFDRIATNAVDSSSALDAGLLANTTYFYRVRAFNIGGDSLSSIASVTTLLDASAPLSPNGLVAVAGNGDEAYRSQIVLRWRDRSANEAGFLIERSVNGIDFSAIGTVGANTTLYMDHRLASATTYYYRVRSFNTAGDSAPSNLDGDQTHPRDNLVTAGESATFHAGVEGASPVRYQWRFLDTPIQGATNEALVLSNVQPGDEGAYSVVVTDANRTITSNPAWLFVFAPPLIVEHPASRTNVLGTSATLRVVASGTSPFYYQWRKNGVNLPGAIRPELTLTPITFADQADYAVVVLNSLGSVTSLVARLTVNTAPVARPDRLFAFRDEAITFFGSVLLTNDTDADGDALFLAAVDAASSQGGNAVLDAGLITYAPPAGYLGDDTLGYTLLDARGGGSRGLLTVTVHDNSPPVVAPVSDRVANVLRLLIVSNSATDLNLTNRLTFSLAAGSPTNAVINPTNGTFKWTPNRSQAPGLHLIGIRATDDGFPPQSGTTFMSVVVKDYAELTLGTAMLNAGDSNSVPITLFSSAPLTNAEWQVTLDTSRLNAFTIEPLLPELAHVSITQSGDNHLSLNVSALPDQVLQGTQQLARLHFLTDPTQKSAFVPLDAHGFDCDPLTPGLDPTLLINDGRVVVINSRALLESTANAAGQRTLMLYGKPGLSYILESSTSQLPGSIWRNRGTFAMTNFSRALSIGNAAGGTIYYRARQ